MNTQKRTAFEFNLTMIVWPLLFVLAIWMVFWFELRFGFDFNRFGVRPHTIKGLRGILFSPFIHGDIQHLWHNTLPLLILSTALFYFYSRIAWRVLLFGFLVTGIGTWLLGRPSYHIGASGVIYMLFGFLFLKGILARHFRLMALSFVVVFVYGSLIWYAAPIDPEISWEGHLSGLFAGFGLAVILKQGIVQPPKYKWEYPNYEEEEDEFMQQFDEDGNFSPKPPPEPEPELNPDADRIQELEDGIHVVYNFKPLDTTSSSENL